MAIRLERLLIENGFHIHSAVGLDSPTFFYRTYPQPLSTGRAGGGVCPVCRLPVPPIVESSAGGLYTPTKNIFAKVRSAEVPSDLRL